jgi:hypothetical protein
MRHPLAILLAFLALAARADDEAAFRQSLAAAKHVHVYEALPRIESPHYEAESKRVDTDSFDRIDYYVPPTDAAEHAELRRHLLAPELLKPYSGHRSCGGMHPDYRIAWKQDDAEFTLAISFECLIMILESSDGRLIRDMDPKASIPLKNALAAYDKKRPIAGRQETYEAAVKADIAAHPPLATSAAMREALREAEEFVVYKGLSRGVTAAERERLAAEAERTGRATTTKIDGFDFYLPSTLERDNPVLQNLLMHASTYHVYVGPKRCGGFHPDYAVTWQRGDTTCTALICFGCEEIRIFDGTADTIHDLARDKVQMLRDGLKRSTDN